jgi:hypothetical protein
MPVNEDLATFAVPLTLLIGGGLVALGLLSFMDLNFFKTKVQGKAALAIGLTFILATELLFMTSSQSSRFLSGQKTSVTDCELDGESAFPLERHKKSHSIHNYIVKCMDRAGFDWDTSHNHCQEAPIATNPFCYLPKAAFDRTMVAFQMKFE